MAIDPTETSAPAQAQPESEVVRGMSRAVQKKDKELQAALARIAELEGQSPKAETPSANLIEQAVNDVSGQDQAGRIRELEERLQRAETIARYRDPAVTALLDAGVSPDKITDEFLAAIRHGSDAEEYEGVGPVPHSFSRSVGPTNESLQELTRNWRPGDPNVLFGETG